MKRACLLVVLLLMVACGPAGVEDPTPTAETSQPDNEATQAPTQAAVEEDETSEAQPTESAATVQPEPVDTGDFAVATNPTEAVVVQPYDNTIGASDARITIIEYGDFQ